MNKKKVILLSILSLVVVIIIRIVTAPGVQSMMKGELPRLKKLDNVVKWKGIPGPEDMEISYDQQVIFISSVNRRGDSHETGAIYVIDLRKDPAQQKPVRMDIDYPREFHPHGMTLREMGDQIEIYVISHRPDDVEKIEVFQARRRGDSIDLIYKDSITFDGPYNPNDMRVLENGDFLLSHDSKKGRNEYVDIMFNSKKAPLSYFDGLHFSTLHHQSVMGNGIVHKIENGNTYIYRADTIQQSIDKLELTYVNKKAVYRFVSRIDLPSSPDNLTLDTEGNIYVACHYSFAKFIAHIKDAANNAPTQIFKIDKNDQLTLVYADDGSEYDAASVAIPYGKYLYLGQIFDDYVLRGEMQE